MGSVFTYLDVIVSDKNETTWEAGNIKDVSDNKSVWQLSRTFYWRSHPTFLCVRVESYNLGEITRHIQIIED